MAKWKKKEVELEEILKNQLMSLYNRDVEKERAEAKQKLERYSGIQDRHKALLYLVEAGAFDVAKQYIDFLKGKESVASTQKKRVSHRKKTQEKSKTEGSQGA